MIRLRRGLAVTLAFFMLATGLLTGDFRQVEASSSTEMSFDPVESLDGWGSWNTLTLDTTDYKRGSASLSMTGSAATQFYKALSTPVDTGLAFENGSLNFWYYVDDVNKLDGTIGQIEITSSGVSDADEIAWDYATHIKNKVVNGWNYISLPLSQSFTIGNPDLSAINFFRIYFITSKSPVIKIDDIVFEKADQRAIVMDKADALDGWQSSGTLTLDTQEKAENQASISMTGAGSVEFEKTFTTPFNARMPENAGTLNFFYYVQNIAALSGASGQVDLGSSGSAQTDGYTWDLSSVLPRLTTGWNLVTLRLSDGVRTGQPDLTALNYFRLKVNKSSSVTSKLDTIYFEEPIGSSTEVSFDPAESLDGWGSWNTLTLDTTDYKRGSASISMTGTSAAQFFKALSTPVDTGVTVQNGNLNFWYYVDDVNKLDGTIGQIEITSSGNSDADEIAWDYATHIKNKVVNGWNYISLPLSQGFITGNPDLSAINFFRIYFFTSQSPVIKIDDIVFEKANPSAIVMDKADALDGWQSSGTLTLDTREKEENQASISMTGAGSVEFEKTFTAPFNAMMPEDAGTLNFFYYVQNIAALSGTSGQVDLGSSGSAQTDGYTWDLSSVLPQLTTGWNLVTLKLSDGVRTGQPDLTALNYFRLKVNKSSSVTSKLDTIYFKELQGLPVGYYAGTGTDTLQLTVTNGTGSGNKYVYQKIGMPDYKFKIGDYIEYDVLLDQDIDRAGGIEIDLIEGLSLRDTGWVDQNGISGHPSKDLSDYANGQWYHRKLKITTPAIGKHIDRLLLVGENDTDGLAYSATYKNIVVTDRLGNLQKALFTQASDYTLVGIAYSNLVANSVVTGGPAPQAAQPAVKNTVYPSADVAVAGWDVQDYGADPNGSQDASSAFQQALNDCSLAGGGVVWAPSGTYKMLGSLSIASACTLRGDWKKPTDSDPSVGGTVLLAYAGRNDEMARPFISLGTGAGVRNLSVYYPEQQISNVKPYPYTISAAAMSATVMNVTLVNSYNGISIGKPANAMHYIRDVYGTPLKTGVFVDMVLDVGRIQEVAFSPTYWAQSGLAGAPTAGEITSYIQGSNDSVGLIIGRSDWEVLNGVRLADYATGIRFISNEGGGGSNGSMYNVNITGARTGIDIRTISEVGWLVSGGAIEANAGSDPVGVWGRPTHTGASLQFNKTTFSGSGTAARLEENGLMSFVNTDFQSWNAAGAAIDAQKGSLIVQGSTFAGAASGQSHIHLGANVSSANILSNNYNGTPSVVNGNPANSQIVVDQTPRQFAPIDGAPYERAVHPLPKETDNSHLFVVTDPSFGAAADGVTDDTAAIQDALDAADSAGGGTVYLPAGKYRVNGHLNVPAGTELRGAHDVPAVPAGAATVIYAYPAGDHGQATGTPFIKLNSNSSRGGSGVRGLLIWYPEQDDVDNVAPYPWTIQSQGPNCWVIYTNVSNAYQGVDFGTYDNDGHVVDYLSGAGLKTGLFVGNTSTEGWVENVHFNPTFWSTPGPLLNAPTSDITMAVWDWQKANGTGFLYGHVANGHVSETFIFGAKDGIRFIEQPGLGGFSGTVLNHGTDGAVNGVRFSGVGAQGIDLVNLEAVQFEGNFVIVENTVGSTDQIRLFNTNHWTSPTVGYDIHGGNLLLQQVHFAHGGTNAVKVTAGTVNVQANYFATAMPQMIRNDGGTIQVTGSVAAGGVTTAGSVTLDANVTR
ncbi:glycoside hydrolase family 55 protein [Paenibacillus agaridevorans]|uniref:glycoside hydrolase family 55 protein n=1 Tax=Paenibacillus agaridevorans TaxID=171404 RepID=UPI001BE40990|nr:glycoside hydrolase family 55 protein [Paenibacillus agaridevorans]